jgi:hypothetical protein
LLWLLAVKKKMPLLPPQRSKHQHLLLQLLTLLLLQHLLPMLLLPLLLLQLLMHLLLLPLTLLLLQPSNLRFNLTLFLKANLRVGFFLVRYIPVLPIQITNRSSQSPAPDMRS